MKKMTLTVMAILLVVASVASAWDWMTPFKRPSKDIRTLIVTGNYTKHRILAELIQLETQQPILLLPATPAGKIFFMPGKKAALEIRDSEFTNFVKFAKPEKILVIGDGGPVTQSYIDRIDPYQTKIVVFNKNMEQAAIEIGRILDLTDLADDFAKINKDLESGKLYKSGSGVSAPGPASSISQTPSIQPAPLAPVADPVLPPKKEEPILINENDVVPK